MPAISVATHPMVQTQACPWNAALYSTISVPPPLPESSGFRISESSASKRPSWKSNEFLGI